MKKRLFLVLSFFFAYAIVFGQADTTVVFNPPDAFPSGGGVIDYIEWGLMYVGALGTLLLVLELFLSALPTGWDLSPLVRIRQLLDKIGSFAFIFRNNKLGGGKFVAKSEVKGNDEG